MCCYGECHGAILGWENKAFSDWRKDLAPSIKKKNSSLFKFSIVTRGHHWKCVFHAADVKKQSFLFWKNIAFKKWKTLKHFSSTCL